MGYWAKNGAYVYDDDDIRKTEAQLFSERKENMLRDEKSKAYEEANKFLKEQEKLKQEDENYLKSMSPEEREREMRRREVSEHLSSLSPEELRAYYDAGSNIKDEEYIQKSR